MSPNHVTLSDAHEIIRSVAAGDRKAFAELVARYQSVLFRWAVGLVHDPDEADDIVQEAFILILNKAKRFQGSGSAEGWMYRITARVAQRMRHKRTRRRFLLLSPSAHRSREVYITDPGGRIDRERAFSLVRTAVLLLPPRQREVFDLCELQGLTPHEAADLLGIQGVSVRANLHKARASVRRRLLEAHPRFKSSNL